MKQGNTAILASKMRAARLIGFLMVCGLCGCQGIQSTLAPHGPAAKAITDISWAMFYGAAAILLLVMILALYAVYGDPDKRRPISGNAMIAAGGVGLPLITLSALLVYGVYASGALRSLAEDAAVHIEVVGNQWWWDVYYLDPGGDRVIAATANEIHIPVGVPVAIRVRTNDVIHSFWVPNLAGKIDLIPGRANHITLRADQAGVFRGQCAEYCGAQHARMAFFVVAEPQSDFSAWLERQRLPAIAPADPVLRRGYEAFLANDCLQCHTLGGVGVAKQRGPDLTHVASRLWLGAGSLENNPANLAAFIARSQSIKPGNAMPSYPDIDDQTLQSIVAYLGSLE